MGAHLLSRQQLFNSDVEITFLTGQENELFLRLERFFSVPQRLVKTFVDCHKDDISLDQTVIRCLVCPPRFCIEIFFLMLSANFGLISNLRAQISF